MASEVFKTIFLSQIKQFVAFFSEESDAIFKGCNNSNVPFHPGEYGKYREESCKETLRMLLGKDVGIADGFVITSDNQKSTQCDIIVYNSNISPFISNGTVKIFPAEEVRMIGEIKSTISSLGEYEKILRKLANNKKIIMTGRQGDAVHPPGREAQTYDSVISFLVCQKLNFNLQNIRLKDIYSGIESSYWHNSILSIEDGFIDYLLQCSIDNKDNQIALGKKQRSINTIYSWQYPVFINKDCCLTLNQNIHPICVDDKYDHIINFFLGLASCNKDVWIYSYDPIIYSGKETKSVFIG